jgi:hypothetical protein
VPQEYRDEAEEIGAADVCVLQLTDLRESSGLVVSLTTPDVLWTHNDSGGGPQLYAFKSSGAHLGTYTIDEAESRDWEDIAAVAWKGQKYLVAADIGGNNGDGGKYVLYAVLEPDSISKESKNATLPLAQRVEIQLPESTGAKPIDFEAFAIDPRDRSILLVEKVVLGASRVYQADWPDGDARIEAREIGRIAILVATGMDISRDGSRLLIGSYSAVHEFRRAQDRTWQQALVDQPQLLASLRGGRQYEAFCYSADGKSCYLTREVRPTRPSDMTPLLRITLK